MSTTSEIGTRYLSMSRLCDKLSRKKSWAYSQLQNDPSFPKPLRIGTGGWPVWVEAEIDAWVMQARRGASADLAKTSGVSPPQRNARRAEGV